MTHTKEEKIELGLKELDILRRMFKAWLESDFNWALEIITTKGASGEEDEWNFLWREWIDKFENWMVPYVNRMRDTEYITGEELDDFGGEVYDDMKVMLLAIKALSEDTRNGQNI